MNYLPEDEFNGQFSFGLPDAEAWDLAGKIYPELLAELKVLGINVGPDPTQYVGIKAGHKQIVIFIISPRLTEHLDRLKKVVLDNIPAGYPCEFVLPT